jgi:dihydrofolate reductase
MKVSLIVAMARNRVIGDAGRLVWRLPADLRFFKRTTMGHHVLMGRKTWDSIGRPLPGRTFVVITRQHDFSAPGCHVAHSLEDALALARAAGEDEAFVIGGAEIYALALPLADRIYLTRVDASFPGDTSFPDLDAAAWTERSREPHDPDADNPWPYAFTVLERNR